MESKRLDQRKAGSPRPFLIGGDGGSFLQPVDVRKSCGIGYHLSEVSGGKRTAPFPVFLVPVGKSQCAAIGMTPRGEVILDIGGVGIKKMTIVDRRNVFLKERQSRGGRGDLVEAMDRLDVVLLSVARRSTHETA